MSTPSLSSAAPNTSFRSLVLPREHGSWSLALEPVALGLLVAPSHSGVWLALAVVAGFFTRRPLKLAVTLPSSDARRAAAARWSIVLAALALAALLASASANISPKQQAPVIALWPLLFAIPFGAAFLWFDLRGEMREAEAELSGSAAFALVPAAFATLAGWEAAPALGLAALMLARSIPTVLTVRTYVRLAKGKPGSALPALSCACLSFIGVAALAAFRCVPAFAGVLVAALAVRSAIFLSQRAPAWSARRVGIAEALLGVAYLGGLTAAYALR